MIWAFNLLVMPLLGLFGLGCMFLNDLLKGNFRTERFVGPEVRINFDSLVPNTPQKWYLFVYTLTWNPSN